MEKNIELIEFTKAQIIIEKKLNAYVASVYLSQLSHE